MFVIDTERKVTTPRDKLGQNLKRIREKISCRFFNSDDHNSLLTETERKLAGQKLAVAVKLL